MASIADQGNEFDKRLFICLSVDRRGRMAGTCWWGQPVLAATSGMAAPLGHAQRSGPTATVCVLNRSRRLTAP